MLFCLLFGTDISAHFSAIILYITWPKRQSKKTQINETWRHNLQLQHRFRIKRMNERREPVTHKFNMTFWYKTYSAHILRAYRIRLQCECVNICLLQLKQRTTNLHFSRNYY